MKYQRSIFILAITILVLAFLYTTSSKAASYDIKEDVIDSPAFVIAERTSVSAEKVMNGVTDLDVTMSAGKDTQRVIIQCDANTQSLNVFYYMKDVLGGKAKGATGMAITLYYADTTEYVPLGLGAMFQSEKQGKNLRNALTKISGMDDNGVAVLEFYEVMADGSHSTVAYSQALKAKYFASMVTSIDAIEGSEGCNIDSGFASISPLVRLGNNF